MAWNDLTTRQQMLDREIGRCGIKLDGTDSCIRKVMRAVGASDREESFVRSRIALRLRAKAALQEADELTGRTESMLDDFRKDDEEWERKGRRLGFKFWD